MNDQTIAATKMICKSIEALTREIYLLRKEILKNKNYDGVVCEEENNTPRYNRG